LDPCFWLKAYTRDPKEVGGVISTLTAEDSTAAILLVMEPFLPYIQLEYLLFMSRFILRQEDIQYVNMVEAAP